MPRLRLIHGREWAESYLTISDEFLSEPERELRAIIQSPASSLGLGAIKPLMELWLDESACMDSTPGLHSPAWRPVSLAASVKLAGQVIASQLSLPCL